MRVETLIVFATNRKGIIVDQVDAIRWAHTMPHAVVCVDDTLQKDDPLIRRSDNFFRIASKLPGRQHLSGFKNNEGIRFAIETGIDFRYVLCLDDDALPIARGIDEWAIEQMDTTAIDLLGVRDRVNYQGWWQQAPAMLGRWLPEAKKVAAPIDINPESVFYAVNWMSRGLVDTLAARNLLVPDGCEEWDYWPDLYISWVTQLVGGYIVTWGSMDDPRPPIYANHRNHMKFAPNPRILRRDFMIYHPIRQVTMYDERTLREYYAQQRREADQG